MIVTFLNAVVTLDAFTASLKRRLVLRERTRPRLLVLENFIICLPLEIPRNIAFIPSILKRVQRWRVYNEWGLPQMNPRSQGPQGTGRRETLGTRRIFCHHPLCYPKFPNFCSIYPNLKETLYATHLKSCERYRIPIFKKIYDVKKKSVYLTPPNRRPSWLSCTVSPITRPKMD